MITGEKIMLLFFQEQNVCVSEKPKLIPRLSDYKSRGSSMNITPETWDVNDVAEFLKINDCSTYCDAFIEQVSNTRNLRSYLTLAGQSWKWYLESPVKCSNNSHSFEFSEPKNRISGIVCPLFSTHFIRFLRVIVSCILTPITSSSWSFDSYPFPSSS